MLTRNIIKLAIIATLCVHLSACAHIDDNRHGPMNHGYSSTTHISGYQSRPDSRSHYQQRNVARHEPSNQYNQQHQNKVGYSQPRANNNFNNKPVQPVKPNLSQKTSGKPPVINQNKSAYGSPRPTSRH
ncbi:hypothetical protein [Budvicia aquatica]|uniref:Lipoprotein n=1 Tax=Budvicia aquatica TaxID=82979 RepID=A0A2C6DMR1_9GAMM|nr:hypothetical protein [Budvicia aquatica]PHI30507.1 hypothetical protein CRN84_14745 [Budvicia aquatica]VFS49766.1 Uncharacterised protein [Budvicia aquatica]